MKKYLFAILSVFGIVGAKPALYAEPSPQFIFVKIWEQLMPIDRGSKYEDPLDATLRKEGVGEVSGGGSQLSDADSEGKRSIEWVGIDVKLSDFQKGLPILKRELRRLGASPDSILEYTRENKKVEEKLGNG